MSNSRDCINENGAVIDDTENLPGGEARVCPHCRTIRSLTSKRSLARYTAYLTYIRVPYSQIHK